MKKQDNQWQPQTWIALASAGIAFCALGLSIWQGWLQRQYWRLTVQPRMTISFFYNNDGAGYLFGGTGIGYATLKTFEVLVDSRPQANWLEMCHSLGFQSPPKFQFVVPRPGTIFKPDSYDKVFWIPAGQQADELKREASRIAIRACYCSIYNECWRIDNTDSTPKKTDSCPIPEVTFTSPPRPIPAE